MALLHDLVWGLVLVPYFFARVIWTLLFGPLGLFNDLLVVVGLKWRPPTGEARRK